MVNIRHSFDNNFVSRVTTTPPLTLIMMEAFFTSSSVQPPPAAKSRIVPRDVLVSNVSVAESSNGSEAGPSSEYENWEEDYDQMLENENQETSERRKSINQEDDYDYMG